MWEDGPKEVGYGQAGCGDLDRAGTQWRLGAGHVEGEPRVPAMGRHLQDGPLKGTQELSLTLEHQFWKFPRTLSNV